MRAWSAILAATVLLLGLREVTPASDYVRPELRHANYIAIDAAQGTRLECRVTCIAHGYRAYMDVLKCRLVGPNGFVEARGRAEPEGEEQVAVDVSWKGRCALETNSGWNLNTVRFGGEVPHAYISRRNAPLKTVRAWGPLYFYVPKGTPYFNVFVHASVRGEGLHFTLRNPSGEIVWDEDGDFDKKTKVQIVPAKYRDQWQDAAAWSIEIAKPTSKGMNLDDVYVELGRHLPPFLSSRPEWARQFAGNWRYDPEADKRRRDFANTEPKVRPFQGARGPVIDRAYSRDTSGGWTTSLPFTYVLDYGSKHLGNPDYVPTVATAPPTLLHLGKDVPLNHGWGPVKALGGENQAYGRGDHIDRISPEEVQERIQGLRAMTDALRKKGVRWVTPYICAMTVNGDEKKRTGFWEFYDHWDEYRHLGLCPRPAADPFEWLQRHPDGRPRIYYGYKYPDEYYPPFKTNHRYAACWHTEGWRTWLTEVVRFAAKCGHDGVFVDNGTSQRCQCARCLVAFRRMLKKRFEPQRARQVLGAPIGQAEFPEKTGTDLHAEMIRYWCETIREEMAALKEVGSKELGREFIIFPNGGRPSYIQAALRDTDFVMFEKSHGEYGTHPGMALCPMFEGLKLRAWNDHVFEYKFVQCLRRRVKPIILSRPGYPGRVPWLMLNPNCARLGFAECGAFSGGGGFLVRPKFGVYHDAQNEYRRFFEEHPHLYAGMETYAQTAVLACPEQGWYGNPAHMGAVKQITEVLTESQVLFDYVSEEHLSADVLARYGTVVAAHFQRATEAQLKAILDFVRDGGRLVLIGGFAGRGEGLTEREAPLCPRPGQEQRFGQGVAVQCGDVGDLTTVLGDEVSVLSCADSQLGAHVKVNAFCALGGAAPRIVVHVLNYNVPLGVDAEEPKEVGGIAIALPLPPDAEAVAAKCYAPNEPNAQSLAVQTEGGRAHVAVPRLRIYRVLEITLSK